MVCTFTRRIAQINGTVVNGSVTTLGSGGTLLMDLTSPGTLASGATDHVDVFWTRGPECHDHR